MAGERSNAAAAASALFQPVAFGSLTAKNRLVRAATYTALADEYGYPTPELADAYARLAKGGAGIIITGLASVTPDGNPYPRTEAMHGRTYAEAWCPVVDRVHEHGAAIVLQLVHAGSATKAAAPVARIIAPSAVKNPKSGVLPEEATAEDMQRVAAAFGQAAALAQSVGFDGVEVHAAHGYLLSQFLSPALNQRADRYGGSPENRSRFVEECVRAVCGAVGESFPVFVKLNSSDGFEGGLTEDESLACALRLARAGATAIEVSGAWRTFSPERTNGTPYFAGFAQRLASAGVPVVLTGGCRSASELSQLTEGGIAAFGLGRPLICEPDLPNRWQADAAYVSRCTSCNACSRLKGCRCALHDATMM